MIALIASALLGLYVFLPVFIFDKAAEPFVRLKRHERSRTEEIVIGIVIAGLPFLAAFFASGWIHFIGHHPFAMSDAEASLKISDYKIVFNSLYSDHYFDNHIDQFWASSERVLQHQLRFLVWNYCFLIVEIVLVLLPTLHFGRLHKHKWFRATVGKLLLKRVSEWEPLFTSFVFHPSEKRRVEIDLMTSDGHLYRGNVENHFLSKDGDLRGLLLKNTRRFRYAELKADRIAGKHKSTEMYWSDIPGSNMYIPYDKMVTLNLRYESSNPDLLKNFVKHKVESLTGIEVEVNPEIQSAEKAKPINLTVASPPAGG
jgi:hypothetical protein